jgi:branched-chain amino acid aminotransferase
LTQAGADEALMLDPNGFVATCNSTHFFIVRKGEIWTSLPKHILHGITRQNVINLARENGIVVKEMDFSLTKVYSADEAFVTGTMAGQVRITRTLVTRVLL